MQRNALHRLLYFSCGCYWQTAVALTSSADIGREQEN